MSLNDIIKKYSVQIKYNGSDGSGVIVKINEKDIDYFYILTAKHTFFEEDAVDEEALKNMDEKLIDKEKIRILDFEDKVICKEGEENILGVIGIDKKYDFLLLKINTYYGLAKLKALNIFKDNFTSCVICGYPDAKSNDDNKILPILCEYVIKSEKNKSYEVKPIDTTLTRFGEDLSAVNEMGGLSGSGVFFGENHDKLSLVGIQVKAPSLQMLQCLDLRAIIGEINEKLDIPILVQNKLEEEKVEQPHIIPRDGYIEPRTVYIEKLDIYVAVCPVTFEEYDLLCSHENIDKPNGFHYSKTRGKRPVVNINWNQAEKYSIWLKKKTNKNYRLLTSEEWDFIKRENFLDKTCLDDFIWHKRNSDSKIQLLCKTKVGSLGIFDIYGHIKEWCDSENKKGEKEVKGLGCDKNLKKILNHKKREYSLPYATNNYIGFRICY